MTYLTGALGIALVLALLAAGTGWKHAISVQEQFDEFKEVNSILAKKQKDENDRLKKEAEDQRKLLEAGNAKAIADIKSKYALELARVRNHVSTSAGRLPEASPAPGVCAAQADNDRLSDSLSSYRSGIITLLEQCEQQTQTLITCQEWISR